MVELDPQAPVRESRFGLWARSNRLFHRPVCSGIAPGSSVQAMGTWAGVCDRHHGRRPDGTPGVHGNACAVVAAWPVGRFAAEVLGRGV